MVVLMASVGINVIAPAPARADDVVTYEVTSNFIDSVTVDYSDGAGRSGPVRVTLPWRANVAVSNPLRADATIDVSWEPAQRYKFVQVRMFVRGSKLCESTLDAGKASCTGRGAYGGVIPPFLPPVEPPGLL